ncbi:uncharacterized protein LOC134670571 [Cydia fagiglandana]|uniref:uncharacterized protein LOC134670571 n=1 Tax=Cydia fagiglandana TaxID=1458189 RepID=UPI002FEE63CB
MSAEIRYKLAKLQIDLLCNAAESAVQDNTKLIEFKTRCSDLVQTKNEYKDAYVSVEAGKRAGFDPDKHLQEFLDYDAKLNNVSVIYAQLFPVVSSNVVNSQFCMPDIPLPRISLPSFTGDVTKWTNFINIFKSIIDESATIKPVRKLHYLISCLSGEPLDLVKHLPLTDQNYGVALTLLENRFSNIRLIADTHLEAIMSLPAVVNLRSDLRSFLNTFNEHLAALRALKFKPDECKFELSLSGSDIPKYSELIAFLEYQCKALEMSIALKATVSGSPKQPVVKTPPHRNTKMVMHVQESNKEINCRYCNLDHYMYMCNKFKALNLDQRRDFLKSKNLCFNCFGTHKYHECSSLHKCKLCRAKHHTLICPSSTQPDGTPPAVKSAVVVAEMVEPSYPEGEQEPNSITSVNNATMKSFMVKDTKPNLPNILLATAMGLAGNGDGHFQPVRLFIDPGAECSIISEECVQRLQLKHNHQPVSIYGVGPSVPHRSHGMTNVFLKSMTSDKPLLTVSAVILKYATGDLPSVSLSADIKSNYQGLQLADNDFFLSRPIDILLGSDVYNDIFCGEKVWPSTDLPAAYGTIFGWPVAFTCDIKGMYRQVLVHPDDRDYQRILWRQHTDDPIREFRLRTVTFGVSSSPFLAMRCIWKLAEETKTSHPVASQILSDQIFVDDIVTGAPDLDTARKTLPPEV